MDKTIAFVGAGNMGSALIRGACRAIEPGQVVIYDPHKGDAVAAETGCVSAPDGKTAAAQARYVMLCVKPQVLPEVLEELVPVLEEGQVLVSIAAGVQLEKLESILAAGGRELPVIRIMPNTPAAIGEGVLLTVANGKVTEEEYQGLEGIKAISTWGPNEFETYSIHQLEPVMMLMGADAARVMHLPGEGWYTLAIEFADGRKATITGFAHGSPFLTNVEMETGAKLIEVKSDYFHHFIAHMVAFFRDPQLAVPHAETLRIMAVRGAGLKAIAAPGTWVRV